MKALQSNAFKNSLDLGLSTERSYFSRYLATANIPIATSLIPALYIVIKQNLLQIHLILKFLPRKHCRDDVKSQNSLQEDDAKYCLFQFQSLATSGQYL